MQIRSDLAVEDGLFVERHGVPEFSEGTVSPAYIDSHCHILPTGLDLLRLNLVDCGSREDVLDAVRDWHKEKPDGWLRATHYDQTKFAGAQHLTRYDLDAISTERPILLRHSNGHASIANSAALHAAGITKDTPDPKGGEFLRDPDGKPNGVLLEKAHENVTASAPKPELDEMVEAIMRAGRLLSGMGITCASDMMTGCIHLETELNAYRIAAEKGCQIRTRLYMLWSGAIGPRGLGPCLRELCDALPQDNCRAAGLKIFADGAIGSATAAIHSTFKTTGGQGTLIYQPKRLNDMVLKGHDQGWPIAIHSIGDRSTDLVMDALEAAGEPSRHRIEHAMILSDEQITRLARLNVTVTQQPEFLTHFSHAYRVQLQDDVYPLLNRSRSLLDAGIRFSANTDRPIVKGDPQESISALTNRPEGYDSSENITEEQAVHAWTVGAAAANDDAGTMGELKAGQHADFLVKTPNGVKTYKGGVSSN
jgi:predicted amidohydrolase YtcJ